MHHVYLVLFTIPVISMIMIGLYQVLDEMFKKKFVLERRAQRSANQPAAEMKRRRYSDSVPPGTLRNPGPSKTDSANEVPVAQTRSA